MPFPQRGQIRAKIALPYAALLATPVFILAVFLSAPIVSRIRWRRRGFVNAADTISTAIRAAAARNAETNPRQAAPAKCKPYDRPIPNPRPLHAFGVAMFVAAGRAAPASGAIAILARAPSTVATTAITN